MRRGADAIWDEVDGTMTVCNTSTGELFELNGTGRLIWESCSGSSAEAIAEALHVKFPDQAPRDLLRDVHEYLQALASSGLVEMSEAERAGG
jgi:Coenzyme PQQ synthesis protein D (PqqD)